MQEEYQKKDKKLYMCFVDMQKGFDRVPRKVIEWAMRKKCLSEVIVRAVMSLYVGAKTRVSAIVVNVITENARRGVVNELLYADDLVLMSETMEDLKKRFWNWKNVLESKSLKVRKTKVMVNGLEGELFKSKIELYGVCGRRVTANSVLCTKCGNLVHGGCAKVKRVTGRLAMHFACSK